MSITTTADLTMIRKRDKKGTLRGGLEDIFRTKKKTEFYLATNSAMEVRTVAMKDVLVNGLLKLNYVFGYFDSQLKAAKDAAAKKGLLTYDQMKTQVANSFEKMYSLLLDTLHEVKSAITEATAGEGFGKALTKAVEIIQFARREGEVLLIDKELLAVGHHIRLIEAKLLAAYKLNMVKFQYTASQMLTDYAGFTLQSVPSVLHLFALISSTLRVLAVALASPCSLLTAPACLSRWRCS